MGTAFTAVSDDIGFLESNPAASAVQKYSGLTFIHHSWIADSAIESLLFTTRANDFGFGVSGKFLYLPFTAYDVWGTREGKGVISESVATVNVSYNLFKSFEFYGLALGVNLKAAYRHIPENIYAGQSAFTAMMDFGSLTRFNLFKPYVSKDKNFSLGIALKNLGFDALGEPLPLLLTAGFAYSFVRP